MLRGRLPIPLVAVAILAVGCGGGGAGNSAGTPTGGPTSPAKAKPNIVFVVADDLDSDSTRVMAKTRALVAARGVTFANAFASDPVCCPSRASMFRGQYAHNHGILNNGRGNTTCFDVFKAQGHESSTIVTWLKALGYRTGLVGKYLNKYPGNSAGFDYIPPSWDYWFADFSDVGSDAYYNYNVNDNAKIVAYGSRPEHYLTDVLAGKTLEFINKAVSDKQPFFLWLAPSAPHVPAEAAPRHKYTFANERAPRHPSFNEADMRDKPKWFRDLPLLTKDDIGDVDDLYRRRLDSLMAVDDAVEQIVNTLQAAGQLENTYIFFTSDNGFLSGQHRFTNGKEAAYEESIRIPLLVSGPGVPAGGTLSHDIANIDFPVTVAELAGVTPPDFVDGRSFASLLRSDPTPVDQWRKDLLLEHFGDPGGLPSFLSVRTDDWVYVRYEATSEYEFYDLKNDPFQLDSRLQTYNPAVFQSMSNRLDALRNCRGAACR